MRRLLHAALAIGAIVGAAASAHAQALGPQRQFLAIEPYYEHLSFDLGENLDKASLNGFGARLWINTEPFHFIPNGSIALFATYLPARTIASGTITSARQDHSFGAEYDQYFVRRPLGGVVDPFLSIGYERYSTRNTNNNVSQSYNGLPVGGGIRIPLPNRFELRGDAKDLILFNVPNAGTTTGTKRTTNNLLLQAGLGLTF